MKRATLCCAFLMIVSACASYTEEGLFGGFRETKLAQNTYRIQSSGNAYTSRKRTNAIAFVRAAELASENGYDRLIVLGYDEWAKTSSFTTPGSATTTSNFYGSAYTSHYSGYSNTHMSGTGYSRTTYNPGQTIVTEKPRTDMVVKFIGRSSPEFQNALMVEDIVSEYGKSAGVEPAKLEAIVSNVNLKPSVTSPQNGQQSSLTSVAQSQINTSSEAVQTQKRQRVRSISDVYDSLNAEEREYVESLNAGERTQYLYNKSFE